MTRTWIRLVLVLGIHLLLQCVPHAYLAGQGEYDHALFRMLRRTGLPWLPDRGPYKSWAPQSGTWHSDQLLGHVQSQMRFNYTAQQYATRALSVYLTPAKLLVARPLMTRLQMYATIDMPRMTWVAAHGWSVRHHPLMWFLEQQLPAVDTEANATRALQAGHLDALLRCTSQPQAYNQGPQPQANCSLVLHPSSLTPQVLSWTLAPSSTRPPATLCAVHAASSDRGLARPPSFTPDMPEASHRTQSSCRPRAALFGAQRRRPRIKGRDVVAAALWWLLPHQPLLRLLPAVADTHWMLFLVLGLEGWAACYNDLLSLCFEAKSLVTTAFDWWRTGVNQPLLLLRHVAAQQALVATFFATVYAWSALALAGPLLGLGWALHAWVPKEWVTGATFDLLYCAWLMGVRWLRPVVSQVLRGALTQLRQWVVQPDTIHARIVIGGRVNPQEAANALRVLADRMEYLHAPPPLHELWHSARRTPVRVLGNHWPSPLRVPPGLDLGALQVPRGFLCPITQDVMALPAMLIAGSIETPATYDKEAIQEWLRHARTDPRSRQPLSEDAQLIPNLELYRSLEDWLEAAQQQQQQQQQQQKQQQQQQAVGEGPTGSGGLASPPRAVTSTPAGAAAGVAAGQGLPSAPGASGSMGTGHQQQQQQRAGSRGMGSLLGRLLHRGRHNRPTPQGPQQGLQQLDLSGGDDGEDVEHSEDAAGGPWHGLHRLSQSTGEESPPGTPMTSTSEGDPSSTTTTTGGSSRPGRVRSRQQGPQPQQQEQRRQGQGQGQGQGQQQQPASPSASVSMGSMAAAAAAAARRAGSAVAAAAAVVGGRGRSQRRRQPPTVATSSDDHEEEVMGPPRHEASTAAAAAREEAGSSGRYNLRRRAASAPSVP